MTDATPYIVPKEPGLGRALTLAALVHAALLAFLWIGVQWQSEIPSTIEAEVWSPQPREAAPPPPPPEPVKAPEPEPKPVVEEPPKPKVVEPPPVEKKVDIALEQEKKRKAQEEKKKREEEEREKERLAKEKKRIEEEKKKRLEEEKIAKLRQEEEKRKEKQKAEQLKKEKEAAEKRKREEAEAQMLAKLRDEEMRRVTGGVTGAGGTGEAAKAQGGRASAEYGAKVAARIRSHTVFNVPIGLDGNPPVEYLVELLPDGTLRAPPRKLKASGVPGFDEAVLRAIDKAQPFPRDDKTGAVPGKITISHKPKDQ